MSRILIVDDILENRYLLEVLLRGHGHEVLSAGNGDEALTAARRLLPDLIIADILMPVMDGYSLCRSWMADPALCRIPFVFYTATYTEPEDEEFALSLGAERFIVKPQEPEELDRIIRDVLERHRPALSEARERGVKQETEYLEGHNRALFRKLEKKMTELEEMSHAMAQEKAERRRVEQALLRCEELIRTFLDASPLAVILMDIQGNMLFANRVFVELFGHRAEEIPTIDSLFDLACPDVGQRVAMFAAWNSAAVGGEGEYEPAEPVELRMARRDGTVRRVSVVRAVVMDLCLAIFSDLTENRLLEEQLLHAQKMEVVGRMTGGIVHDLNNILTAIVGYGHLLMQKLPVEGPSRQYVEQILTVSDRASTLTGRICAFSRKRRMSAELVSLDEIVRGIESLLRRLIPRDVELKMSLGDEDLIIHADPGQLEQMLMNLVINARDAIVGKGTITIGTSPAVADRDFGGSDDSGAGRLHALLTVEDNGQGMDEATRGRIFEPFFTTKEIGKGTGLGLSMVNEIVKQCHGFVRVWSEPHRGTKFSIYLPLA